MLTACQVLKRVSEVADLKVSDLKGSSRRGDIVAARVLFVELSIRENIPPDEIASEIDRYRSIINHYTKNYKPSRYYHEIRKKYEEQV